MTRIIFLSILLQIGLLNVALAQHEVIEKPPPPMEVSEANEIDDYILEDGELKRADEVSQEVKDDLEEELETIEDEYYEEDYDGDYEEDYGNSDYEENYQSEKEKSLRNIPQDEWEKVKEDPRYQYKKVKKKKVKEKKPKKRRDWNLNWLNSGFFEVLLYLLVAGFIIFILYSFFKNNEISFGRKKKEWVEEEETPWEDVESFDDWDTALQKAIASGDYRTACRILYLQILQELNNEALIEYKLERTNWQYVQKLFGTDFHDPFRKLTAYFDYVWYGKYEISQEQFERLRGQFVDFKSRISS